LIVGGGMMQAHVQAALADAQQVGHGVHGRDAPLVVAGRGGATVGQSRVPHLPGHGVVPSQLDIAEMAVFCQVLGEPVA